jgi:hypothetical protein
MATPNVSVNTSNKVFNSEEPYSPPTNQTTTKVGDSIVYRSTNYEINVSQKNQETLITDLRTKDTFKAWGDPHTATNGRPTGDFRNDLTLKLRDGTKVTLQTTGTDDKNSAIPFTKNVIITNDNYGAAIKGVYPVSDTLQFRETTTEGHELDAMANDNNILFAPPTNTGAFYGMVNGNYEVIDTTAEYSLLESDDRQNDNHSSHSLIQNWINKDQPQSLTQPALSQPAFKPMPLSMPPTSLTKPFPGPDNDVIEMTQAFNAALNKKPENFDPKFQAAVTESAEQLKDYVKVAKDQADKFENGGTQTPQDKQRLQQAKDEFTESLRSLNQAAEEADSNYSSSSGSGKSWYVTLAKTLGLAANKVADKLQKLADKVASASDKDKPDVQTELQGTAQQFTFIMSAINNVISTLGQAANTMLSKR